MHSVRYVFAAMGVVATAGCGGSSVGSATRELDATPVRFVSVVLTGTDSVEVTAELAATSRERERGLMFRRYLAPRGGMLFVFEDDAPREFWMENTFVSLDVIFLDSSGTVVGVVERTEPLSRDPISVDAASRYVLEVRAGLASSYGVSVGARADLSGLLERNGAGEVRAR